MLALLFIALHRSTGENDLCVLVMNRNRDKDAELESVVGYFVLQQFIRITVTPDSSFRSVIRSCHKALVEAMANDDVPAVIAGGCDSPLDNPVARVLFNVAPAEETRATMGSASLEWFFGGGTSTARSGMRSRGDKRWGHRAHRGAAASYRPETVRAFAKLLRETWEFCIEELECTAPGRPRVLEPRDLLTERFGVLLV